MQFPSPSPMLTPGPIPVPMPVPMLWMDDSSKADGANNALFQSAACSFNFEPYCRPSALPSPAPEFCLNDSEPDSPANWVYRLGPTRALSTISCETAQTSSSAGSLLSPVQTDRSDTLTARGSRSRGPSPLGRRRRTSTGDSCSKPLLCLGPRCVQTFTTEDELKSHVEAVHTYSCNWAGCDQPSFASRDGLIWHVKAEHLLVCPSQGCTESSFQSIRVLRSHMDISHSKADGGIKEWQLTPTLPDNHALMQHTDSPQDMKPVPAKDGKTPEDSEQAVSQILPSVNLAKTKYQDQLRRVLEKRSKKNAGRFTLPLPRPEERTKRHKYRGVSVCRYSAICV